MLEFGHGPTHGAMTGPTGFSSQASAEWSNPGTSSGPMVPALPDRIRQRTGYNERGSTALGQRRHDDAEQDSVLMRALYLRL